VHWPDLETTIAEAARTLEDLSHEGKIRAIGVIARARLAVSLEAVLRRAMVFEKFEKSYEANRLSRLARHAGTALQVRIRRGS
jgi:aryl-alcohol dehydrogenase-like predicted oxidoreductase